MQRDLFRIRYYKQCISSYARSKCMFSKGLWILLLFISDINVVRWISAESPFPHHRHAVQAGDGFPNVTFFQPGCQIPWSLLKSWRHQVFPLVKLTGDRHVADPKLEREFLIEFYKLCFVFYLHQWVRLKWSGSFALGPWLGGWSLGSKKEMSSRHRVRKKMHL